MPALTCSPIRAEVKRPMATITSTADGTACSTGKICGSTWYQRKSCTISGMLRNSSVQTSPNRASFLFGTVRRMPISEPATSATSRPATDTYSVQPQAWSMASR